jgi:hypothetical protein
MLVRAIFAVLALTLILTFAGCSATPALSSIEVTPPAGAQSLNAIGLTAQFRAVGTFGTGGVNRTTRDITNEVQWSSSTVSVGTIDSTGLATAVGAGITTITATMNGTRGVVTGTSDLSVSTSGGAGHALVSLSIIPANQTVSKLGETAQYIAIGTFSSAPTNQDMTSQVTWQSSDVTIAQIDASGLATAIACPVSTGTPPCVTTITALNTDPTTGTTITGTSTFTQDSAGGGGNLPTLTVYLVGLGSGTVISTPSGINCTGSGTGCTGNFVLNSSVKLEACNDFTGGVCTPPVGFGGWSANCTPDSATSCTVGMGDNTTVGVIFNK